MKLTILIKKSILKLLCKLGVHDKIKMKHYNNKIFFICRRCRKELK